MSGNDVGNQVILATASYDHTIKLWQAHSGICQRTLKHPESVSFCGLSGSY
ncbi:Target of rapamycin complex subunit lst8 [Portunus trituberculatus]|uniref:Target of rapamycin complex subunit lst8 n=1 Tax=Portunus trituberculatus TaxID=210409 RepID=A0A5B7J2W6_PORTR|nr:Target of rapamycin complex subunit lst8 [Portunus trituberculatus]